VSQEFSASRAPTWSAEGFPGPRRGGQDEHRAVFDAIAAGEAEAARQAAQRHLLSAAGRLGVVLPTLRAGGLKQVDKETL
jgi:DNA-binding FadR family transcriptional regulator